MIIATIAFIAIALGAKMYPSTAHAGRIAFLVLAGCTALFGLDSLRAGTLRIKGDRLVYSALLGRKTLRREQIKGVRMSPKPRSIRQMSQLHFELKDGRVVWMSEFLYPPKSKSVDRPETRFLDAMVVELQEWASATA